MHLSSLFLHHSIFSIKSLKSPYGPKQLSLQLYNTILGKTQLSHTKAIEKHIELFKTFCVENQDAILKKDSSLVTSFVIEYSEKIKIDFKQIFELADNSEKSVIWHHILSESKEIIAGTVSGFSMIASRFHNIPITYLVNKFHH